MKARTKKYLFDPDSATFEPNNLIVKGYNDRPKPCPIRRCQGMVMPTMNVNVGVCEKCKTRIPWRYYDVRRPRGIIFIKSS